MEDELIDKTRTNREISNANLIPVKPGEVRNPKGRPPNTKYISEALRELAENDPEFLKELVTAIRARAKKGDVPAFKEISDRIEGKVADKIEVDTPVTIILKRAEDRE